MPEILVKLAAPPILVFPDWDVVADGSRFFHVYCDAYIDVFGAAHEQEQPGGSVRRFAYISRATFDSERHWTPLDLAGSSIFWVIKRLRGCFWGTKPGICSNHRALEGIGKVGDHHTRVQRWLEFLTAHYTLVYLKFSANGTADFLPRLPEPATKHGRSRSSSLKSLDGGGIFLIRACGLRTGSSPPRCWLGWAGNPPRERCFGWDPVRHFDLS